VTEALYVDALTPHLRREAARYRRRALTALTTAARRERDGMERQTYNAIDMDAILGSYQTALDEYVATMAGPWGDAWNAGMADALLGTPYEEVGMLDILPSDYDPLVVDSRHCVDYDREAVRSTVLAGMDEGLSPTEIAKRIDEHEAFGAARALRIARTENVRSQESGYEARIGRAVEAGVPITGHGWLSDPLAAQWPRRHDKMHDVIAPIGTLFVLPSGVSTKGPGLSGDPGEDVHCRCARRPIVDRR